MNVVIVSEDQATEEALNRIISYSNTTLNIELRLPARGGKVKSLIGNFNDLAKSQPVILLIDLDAEECAPLMIQKWFYKETKKNENFLINVAVDEVESWLMADREGFAAYFKTPLAVIPTSKDKINRKPEVVEMDFPYKSSLYLQREIIPASKSSIFRDSLIPIKGAKKDPYTILP